MRMEEHDRRIAGANSIAAAGRFVAADRTVNLLAALIRSGDRILIEGDNQKQARMLMRAAGQLDPARVSDLHILSSAIVLPEHLALFERGLARRLDFAFSGPQAAPLAGLVRSGAVRIGAIHTYAELYSRYFTDLVPDVALLAGELADREGNLWLGANAEETPVLCEAVHAAKGIAIMQVEKIVDRLPRVDIPADRVEFVVEAGERPYIQALFTRDPARITPSQILMAMLTIKGIYAHYGVRSINHGIGYATAAIELLLPTYAAQLGLKGAICEHWVLNPHPTLIPAIEAGFVKTICAFGSEPGMEDYIAAHSGIFFTSHDGGLMSNRLIAQVAGHYAVDCFTGATLQIDADGNSSTAIAGRIGGFGGAPNLGSDPPGRRHATPAWLLAGRESTAQTGSPLRRGRKLVLQVTPTVSEKKGVPVFVDELDAVAMAREGLFQVPPVMLHAGDITHIVTECGIACLLRCRSDDERRAAIRAVAGDTPVGRRAVVSETADLRARGVVITPADLGIEVADAKPELLAARSMADLVRISGGLYHPPREIVA